MLDSEGVDVVVIQWNLPSPGAQDSKGETDNAVEMGAHQNAMHCEHTARKIIALEGLRVGVLHFGGGHQGRPH